MRDSHRMRDGIELHLDNRQIAAFVIASLVVLGAVFSVGVLVGKQLASASLAAGGKPGDALAAIDEREKIRTPDSVTGVGEIPAAKPDALNYQKELTKPSTAGQAIEPSKPASAKGDEKPAAKPAEAAAKPADGTAPAAEPKKEEPKKEEATAKKEEPKKEEPAKKKESLSAAFDKATKSDEDKAAEGESSGYTLQVASLPSKEEADKLVSRLAAKGLKPYIVEADVAGKGHVYRVRSGSYASKSEAEDGLKAFKKKSALPAIIANK